MIMVNLKEVQDGQLTMFKRRHEGKGFQESSPPQSVSLTAKRESVKLFAATAASMKFKKLHKIDISAAFLQVDNLKRDVIIHLPKYVCDEVKLWKLWKPLYGLNDAGCCFCLNVNQFLMILG